MNLKVIKCKTVVIGAGMAGIGASLNFLDNNYEDFLVFEALERIGGRVFTDANEKGYLEIGAQWIHGQDGNPIYDVAKKHGLVRDDFMNFLTESFKKNIQKPTELNDWHLHQNFDIKTYPNRVLFPTQCGKKIDLPLASSIYESLTSLISDASTLKLNSNTPDSRVGDFLWYHYNKLLDDHKLLSSPEVNRILYGLFLMRLKRENIRSGCSNVFDLSLKQFSVYKEFPGHSYVETKRGFGPIIEKLMGNNKEKFLSKLHLKHYLKKIILSEDDNANNQFYLPKYLHSNYTNDKSKAVLILCDATNPNEPKDFAVVCDRVICTFSLGYLKENVNHFLQPVSLISQERRLSISKLGFGTINKIFLFYDSPFWSKNVELINLIWLPENDESFRVDRLNHRDDSRKIWYESICKFEVVNSMPNALSAWLAGSEEFEQLDDETIARECTRILRKFLNEESIPMPKSLKRTKWNSNRFSRGSYSHLPLGSSVSDIKNLGQPIPSEENPIILFAGEATEPDYYSTVHGAYLTGLRESKRVLSFISNDRTFSKI